MERKMPIEEKVFFDKSLEPNNDILLKVLGDTAQYWDKIKHYLNDKYRDINEIWKYYYQKSGWFLQIVRKKKTLLWLTPYKEYFCITFSFGDKAAALIEKSDLPHEIEETLKSAKKYQIGRSIPIYIKCANDVENVKKLIDIKVSN